MIRMHNRQDPLYVFYQSYLNSIEWLVIDICDLETGKRLKQVCHRHNDAAEDMANRWCANHQLHYIERSRGQQLIREWISQQFDPPEIGQIHGFRQGKTGHIPATVLAVRDDCVLVEYRRPNGTTRLSVVDRLDFAPAEYGDLIRRSAVRKTPYRVHYDKCPLPWLTLLAQYQVQWIGDLGNGQTAPPPDYLWREQVAPIHTDSDGLLPLYVGVQEFDNGLVQTELFRFPVPPQGHDAFQRFLHIAGPFPTIDGACYYAERGYKIDRYMTVKKAECLGQMALQRTRGTLPANRRW